MDLRGIEYPLFAGGGAIVGCFPAVFMAVASAFYPPLFPWIFAPIAAGAVLGFIFAIFVK